MTARENSLRCRLTAADRANRVYLGRPWRHNAATVWLRCEMGGHLRPEGWQNWNNPENEKTARYAEYRSSGPGANPGARVSWSRQLTRSEARRYTVERVFARHDGWDPVK